MSILFELLFRDFARELLLDLSLWMSLDLVMLFQENLSMDTRTVDNIGQTTIDATAMGQYNHHSLHPARKTTQTTQSLSEDPSPFPEPDCGFPLPVIWLQKLPDRLRIKISLVISAAALEDNTKNY
eukprot:gene5748-11621_t